MKSDYCVKYRAEESIARSALELLSLANLTGKGHFNVTELFRRTVAEKLKIGVVELILFKAKPNGYPAYVTYKPSPKLHFDGDTWADADSGEPGARWVAGHENGHLVLHDHHAKPFSSDPNLRIQFAEKEYSAEWQADTFAP